MRAKDVSMHKDDLQQVGAHLRTIHFSILLSSIALIVVVFGYKNTSVEGVLSELGLILDELNPVLDVGRDEHLSDVEKQWTMVRQKMALKSSGMFSMTGEIGIDQLPSLISPTTSIHSLESCSNWSDISRSDTSDFVEQLQRSGFSSIECVWLGEDQLLFIPIVIPQEASISIVNSDGIRKANMLSAQNSNFKRADSASDLSQCGRWNDISRSEYPEFTENLAAIGKPFYCDWAGENELLVLTGELERSDSVFLVDTVSVRSAKELGPRMFLPLARRVKTSDFENCTGDGPEDVEGFSKILSGYSGEEIEVWCYWYDSAHIAIYEIDWSNNKLANLAEYRNRAGFSFQEAFPFLSEIQESYFDIEDNESAVDWENDNLGTLVEKLTRKRLELGEATIAGVPLKQEILLYCAPPLLVVLQLYFLLHYRYLVSQIRYKTICYPWVGFYRDIPSKAVTVVTLAIVPPSAVLLFTVQDFGLNFESNIAIAFASFIIGISLTRTLFKFWFLPEKPHEQS